MIASPASLLDIEIGSKVRQEHFFRPPSPSTPANPPSLPAREPNLGRPRRNGLTGFSGASNLNQTELRTAGPPPFRGPFCSSQLCSTDSRGPATMRQTVTLLALIALLG